MLKKNRLIYKYIDVASAVGDMESYMYLGVPIGYERARDILSIHTKKIKRLIKPMTQDERVLFGGYNKIPERFNQYNDYISKIHP